MRKLKVLRLFVPWHPCMPLIETAAVRPLSRNSKYKVGALEEMYVRICA